MGADASATLETLSGDKLDTTSLSQILSESSSKSDRPDLATARVVVSGGRGMKSGENFSMLETLADKLGILYFYLLSICFASTSFIFIYYI